MTDDGADRVFTEIPNYRGGVSGARGRRYKLIDTDDERIGTRIADGDEGRIPVEEIPEAVRRDLEEELDREFETTSVTTDVDSREFREDLAALGYLEE